MTLRRDFLAFTAGAVAAKTVLPIASKAEEAQLAPDAELVAIGRAAIHLVDEFDRSSALFFALDEGSPDLATAPSDALDVMLDRATELPAATWGGCVVKARLLHHELLMQNGTHGVFDPEMASPGDMLAWSLVNDMLAVAA